MSRTASELTMAIRTLCEETNGEITHAEARPKLKEMGFHIVKSPERQSAELGQWLNYENTNGVVDYENNASVQEAARSCGFDAATLKKVLNEYDVKIAWAKETSNFNVTKANWKKKNSTSRRPNPTGSNPRAIAAAKVPKTTVARPRLSLNSPSGEEMEALEFVEKHGGLSVVENMLEEAKQEVAKLEETIAKVSELTKRIQAAA